VQAADGGDEAETVVGQPGAEAGGGGGEGRPSLEKARAGGDSDMTEGGGQRTSCNDDGPTTTGSMVGRVGRAKRAVSG
jgi:hypothetical protein